MDTENASTYRPPHGGYPPATPRLGQRHHRTPAAKVIIHSINPPALGMGHVQEAYELGRRDGRAGR